MSIHDAELIAAVIQREGGYTDDPMDRGGPTNMGITQATLSGWRGHPVTPDDVKALTSAEAAAIYYEQYIRKPGFDAVPDDQLRGELFDIAVNSGPTNAVKMLQRALSVNDDGVFGPATLASLGASGPVRISLRLAAQRIRFLGNLIAHDPTQARFAGGWLSRAASFIEQVAS